MPALRTCHSSQSISITVFSASSNSGRSPYTIAATKSLVARAMQGVGAQGIERLAGLAGDVGGIGGILVAEFCRVARGNVARERRRRRRDR